MVSFTPLRDLIFEESGGCKGLLGAIIKLTVSEYRYTRAGSKNLKWGGGGVLGATVVRLIFRHYLIISNSS